jgi:hypothetical protein
VNLPAVVRNEEEQDLFPDPKSLRWPLSFHQYRNIALVEPEPEL